MHFKIKIRLLILFNKKKKIYHQFKHNLYKKFTVHGRGLPFIPNGLQ